MSTEELATTEPAATHVCLDHISEKDACMQCDAPLKRLPRATVTVKLEVYDDDEAITLLSEATMLGKPSRKKGVVYAAEVVTASGRYTLVPIADIEPVNDTAKALLTAPGPVRKAA